MRYLVRGSTLNALKRALRTNRPCAASGLGIASQTSAGTFLRGDAGGGQASGGDPLPEFENAKYYLPTAKTIQAMMSAARKNATRAVTGTGLSVHNGADGVTVSGH
jgi:hypothetical protein